MKHAGGLAEPERRASQVFPELADPIETRGIARSMRASSAVAYTPSRRLKHVRFSTVSFSNMYEFGDLVPSFFKARKECFIDKLGWDLPNTEGMEFDQYDTPVCRWVIMHEYGEILGGLRLMPTTSKCGIYSYMLRDAQLGLLDKIPSHVLFSPAPVSPIVWEGTRLFITESAGTKRRSELQLALFVHMLRTSSDLGAKHLLGLVPEAWSRWIKRLNLDAIPMGPRISIDGDVSQAALMNVEDMLQRFPRAA